jgi:hypothetical protein
MLSSVLKAAPLLCLVVLSVGCSREPAWYVIPEQRKALLAGDAPLTKSFLQMSDEDAPAYFVRDIKDYLEGGSFRWTQQEPTLRLIPPEGPVKVVADLGISAVTLKQTGPVTITVKVNGHVVQTAVYETAGDKHIEKPVPAAWVKPRAENTVALAIDKLWVSPDDGAKLGFVLRSAGFIK